ncbi:ARM repeat-containing protein [Pilatotrama ljubarskyi]|nr:ARM repeat-containing protein [Pilatotrama ljubarskyi]
MTVSIVSVPALKAIKNSVIGNRTAKATLARDEAYVARLIECVNDPPSTASDSNSADTELRVEAAHIIASLSYGSPEALRTLLRLDALRALLYAISTFQPSDKSTLRSAVTRALRALAAAIADAVGPSQWGLSVGVPDVRSEAKVALDYLFQPEVLDVYVPLLLDPSPHVNTAVAQLLGVAVRNPEHRARVHEWCPAAERTREAKGKRGWERRDHTTSPSRQGGWVARTLTNLLQRRDVKLQEAALSALACLVKDNDVLARHLTKAPLGTESVLSIALTLAKSRNTDLQLAACLCATNILRACVHMHDYSAFANEQATPITIMHVLNRIIGSENASNHTRTRACFILYHLVSDNLAFCQLAFERNALAQVASLINSITPTEKSSEFEEDEPESVSRLREAALTAVAAIALFDTDIRTAVTDDLRLIPAIQASLSNHHVGVRYAACQCARALSRAVSALRTNIVDTGLGLAVFQLFMKQDEDRQVLHAASAVICNILTNFSPLRTALLEQGAIPRLVQLLHSDDTELKLNALWAFKNLLYKADPELKREVMSAIGWSEINALLLDPDTRLQEQVFHILRHVADGVEDVEFLFSQMGGSEGLLGSLSEAMESENEDVVLQASRFHGYLLAVFVLANVANSPAHQKSILAHPRILGRLRDCLVDAKVEIRRPAVSCVLELARQNPRSYRELHETGIDATLRHMLEHTTHVSSSPTLRFAAGRQMGAEDDLEVQDKARQALHWLEQAQLNRDALVDMDL